MKYYSERERILATNYTAMAQTLVDVVWDVPSIEPDTFRKVIEVFRRTARKGSPHATCIEAMAAALEEFYAKTRAERVASRKD